MSTELLSPEQLDSAMSSALALVQRSTDEDDRKATYLSYRACFFSEKEALHMTGITSPTLELWREDPIFYYAEVVHLKEFQNRHYRAVLGILAVRNFRLVLQKDYEIVKKWMEDSELSKFEENYIVKLRGLYSGEQIERLFGQKAKSDTQSLDFTQLIINLNQKGNCADGEVLELSGDSGSDNWDSGG